MAEIAERAGVALSTVSYVLSGKRPVSQKMRERVMAAIGHALAFPTWQSLTREGLDDLQAADLMVKLVAVAASATATEL